MKSTGIVRRIDELGRVVIPIELRRTFDIKEGDSLEIFVADEGQIILRKFLKKCALCGCEEQENLTDFLDKKVCKNCRDAMNQPKE